MFDPRPWLEPLSSRFLRPLASFDGESSQRDVGSAALPTQGKEKRKAGRGRKAAEPPKAAAEPVCVDNAAGGGVKEALVLFEEIDVLLDHDKGCVPTRSASSTD
jgi:hypothetical protein